MQARPPLLDPQRDVQVAEPNQQRNENMANQEPGGQTNNSHQQKRPNLARKVKEPVEQARKQDRGQQPGNHDPQT
ncbi:MAG: hypothetical protein K6U08_08040, partial [Firmicutes bacterium]|nr:hypothetical protein [Bacillota bacterium]